MKKTMKAMVYEKYGDAEVLHIKERPIPAIEDNEILVKVSATSVVAGDIRMRKADPVLARFYNGLFKPRKINVLGFEVSGKVAEIGKNVDKFKVDDSVFGFCGLEFGGYAEYKVFDQSAIISTIPANITLEQAAVVPIGAIAALNILTKAKVKKDNSVLIIGAAGSIGSYAVQIAKSLGAHVTGVCSTGKLDFVKSIGADNVIDYKKDNYLSDNIQYDVICDAGGKMITGLTKAKCKNILKKDGSYVHSMMNLDYKLDDLLALKQLIEQEKITPIIDKVFSINDIADAHRYFESGSKKGNIVIKSNF